MRFSDLVLRIVRGFDTSGALQRSQSVRSLAARAATVQCIACLHGPCLLYLVPDLVDEMLVRIEGIPLFGFRLGGATTGRGFGQLNFHDGRDLIPFLAD